MLTTGKPPHSVLVVNLCSHALEEAKSSDGTWTLATHSKITCAMFLLNCEDLELFMTSIVQ
jgi:hypothetical protein